MKKLIIAILAASGATVVQANAETPDRQAGGEFRAEMRALIAGDGLNLEDLTRLMQERSQARFAALDADGDGVVRLGDFLAATDERSSARFERMGPNEDGVVTRAGRERHHKGHHRGHHEKRAERSGEPAASQFSRLDTNGDGSLSPEEFEAGLKARAERFAERGKNRMGRHERRGDMPAEMRQMRTEFRTLLRDGATLETFSELMRKHATARFEALDADGNGELTAEEFTAKVADRAGRLFARMDRNDDGAVNADDRHRGWGGSRGGDWRK
jgi:Ca2+-binding EF-hand superfamily protein